MRAYVVERNFASRNWRKRVGAFHDAVFGGIGEYRTLLDWKPVAFTDEDGERRVMTRPPDWRWPAVTNANREPLHVARSGRFVPAVFSSSFVHFVVSPTVREALSSLPKVGFNGVVFEQLVDVPMPPVGDFSWFDRDDTGKYGHLPEKYLRSRPHVPALEGAVAGYSKILPAGHDDVAERYSDIRTLPLEFGSYAYVRGPEQIRVSRAMLEDYPIVQSPHFVFREDAFARIAPSLDLDYYAIAVMHDL